jgi:probable DNA repair protein
VDINDLANWVLADIEQLQMPYIYGFKTLTPLQQKIFDALNYQPINAKILKSTEQKTFATSADEIQAAAVWAKQQQRKNPTHSIVIVCTQLREFHHQLTTTFDKIFDDLLTETGQKSYNISLGLPLSQYPLVQNLVNLFELSEQIKNNHINTNLFNQILRCVSVKGYQLERNSRHSLINKVSSLEVEFFPLKSIDKALLQCPILLKIIQTVQENPSKIQLLSQHLLDFNATLNRWGFATDRALSSSEFQLLNKYLDASLKLNQLSLHQQKCSSKTALSLLKNITNQVIFQAQSSKSNVQIIGSLEAEGLYFDQAWVMGMTHDFLPAKLNTPRFIASAIAAHHHIPHSDYALIQTDGQNTLTNLQSLANQVIFSYAQTHLEVEQLPSPWLDFEGQVLNPVEPKIQPLNVEKINDEITTEFTNHAIKSGVSLLKDQMACAFKGFAHRLNIKQYDAHHIGLNRLEQGNIIHQALDYIYQEISSKKALIALNPQALEDLISKKIYAALKKYPTSAFKTIEKIRLEKLLLNFIETDKLRQNFRVLETEKSVGVHINGLDFETRLDRLDEMDNGDKIVFDYKTGSSSISKWCASNIDEPQLPIYSTTNDVQGAAFIELKSNSIKFKGLSKDPDSLPKQSSRKSNCQEWDAQLGSWHDKLALASAEFQAGSASVLPNKSACEYCEFDLLCRVQK